MSTIYVTGFGPNLAGLLRHMADEVERWGSSSTAFGEEQEGDPVHQIRFVAKGVGADTLVRVLP